MVSLRQPSTSSSGSSVFCLNATTMASSAGVSTVLFGVLGPIGAPAIVVRLRHFFTVFFAFTPYRAARDRVLSCDAWNSARSTASCGRCREERLP